MKHDNFAQDLQKVEHDEEVKAMMAAQLADPPEGSKLLEVDKERELIKSSQKNIIKSSQQNIIKEGSLIMSSKNQNQPQKGLFERSKDEEEKKQA